MRKPAGFSATKFVKGRLQAALYYNRRKEWKETPPQSPPEDLNKAITEKPDGIRS